MRKPTDFAATDIFGKRIRSYFHRHDLLELFNVR
jgi:hypothetical protein